MFFGYERLSTATLASVGGARVKVIQGLESVAPRMRAVGRSFTVRGSQGDNLALHQAIARAGEGDVIVLDVQCGQETAHCGDMLARAAAARGIRGIVLNGSIRDRFVIAELEFPVFYRGTSPRPPSAIIPGEFQVPVELEGVTVDPGDFVLADADGVVVVPLLEVDTVLAAADDLEAREQEIQQRIDGGETTLEIFNLPRAGLGT